MRISRIAVAGATLLCVGAIARTRSEYRDWAVTGGADNIHYSTLKQINRSNVRKLREVWRFDSQDQFDGSEMECNPIIIGNVLYATTPRMRIVALQADSGKLLWDFDARQGEKIKSKQRNRGLTYWSDGRDSRLFVAIGNDLYALNAQTGKPEPDFGDAGHLDLRLGLGRDDDLQPVGATSPGVIYHDSLILGSIVAEALPAAPGHIRAFDVHTGRVQWMFHTIPYPGEPGYETWPKNAWKHSGGANSWMGMVLDAKRGVVYAPTGSAAFDFYGADRIGDDLYGNCVLALDAASGKLIWYFQAVRHDVWDRDFPAGPALVKVRHEGRMIDAIAQITKSGFIWLLDRDSGKPLYIPNEIAVPASDVDKEVLSTKQILPSFPAPFARQQLTEDILTNRTPEAHAAVLQQFRSLVSGPQFTPPTLKGTVMFPGFDGGGEWGGPAWDPETGVLYVNSNEMPWVLRLVPKGRETGEETGASLYRENCAGCHRADRKGTPPEFPSLVDVGARLDKEQVLKVVHTGAGRMPGFASIGDEKIEAIVHYVMTGEDQPVGGLEQQQTTRRIPLKYGIDGYNKFLDPDGYPAVAPPWGTLNAINLNTGSYDWKIPFGEFPELAAKGMRNTGSENYGGGIVTAGGLLFIAATNHDHKMRAFDKRSGKLLWEADLPAGGNATPALYEVSGKEYVVIGAGGGKSGAPSGGSYVAFALP